MALQYQLLGDTASKNNSLAEQYDPDAALKEALQLVAADLCPDMTDVEFEEIWASYLELRHYKAMQ